MVILSPGSLHEVHWYVRPACRHAKFRSTHQSSDSSLHVWMKRPLTYHHEQEEEGIEQRCCPLVRFHSVVQVRRTTQTQSNKSIRDICHLKATHCACLATLQAALASCLHECITTFSYFACRKLWKDPCIRQLMEKVHQTTTRTNEQSVGFSLSTIHNCVYCEPGHGCDRQVCSDLEY